MSFVNETDTITGDPLILKTAPAYGMIIIEKTSNHPGGAAFDNTGFTLREAYGSIGVGDIALSYLEPGLANVGVGLAHKGEGGGSLDTYGREEKIALGNLDTFNSSPAPTPGLLSFEMVNGKLYSALCSFVITGINKRPGGGALQVVKSSQNVALAVLTITNPVIFRAALASAIIGGLKSANAYGSLDVENGKGIDLLLDLIDNILYSGHGDEC